jgi:hypothetical protein
VILSVTSSDVRQWTEANAVTGRIAEPFHVVVAASPHSTDANVVAVDDISFRGCGLPIGECLISYIRVKCRDSGPISWFWRF